MIKKYYCIKMLEDQPLDLSVRVGDYAELSREDIISEEHRNELAQLSPNHQHINNHHHRHINNKNSNSSNTYNHNHHHHQQNERDPDDYGSATSRLRDLVSTSSPVEYMQGDDRTCSEDSDDSCSDNHKDGMRTRIRPPGTKPYKKNLIRRYRESLSA